MNRTIAELSPESSVWVDSPPAERVGLESRPGSLPGRIAICGGGTAGHVMTGVALAHGLSRFTKRDDVVFIGGEHGLETKILAGGPYAFRTVASGPMARQGLRGILSSLVNTARGIPQARRLLRQLGAKLAVGVGGYASIPGILAARSLGIPTAIVELNAVPGVANRVLGPIVDRVFLGPLAITRPFPADITDDVGLPMRWDVPPRHPVRIARDFRLLPLKIVVVGGSLGSGFLNQHAPPLLARIAAAGISLNILHLAGDSDFDAVTAAYSAAGIDASVHRYLEDFPDRLRAADFALTSAGALTLAELASLGVPCMLVPDPSAAHDHQSANSAAFSRLTGCLAISPHQWSTDDVAELLLERLNEPRRLRAEVTRMRSLAGFDAALQLARHCIRMMQLS